MAENKRSLSENFAGAASRAMVPIILAASTFVAAADTDVPTSGASPVVDKSVAPGAGNRRKGIEETADEDLAASKEKRRKMEEEAAAKGIKKKDLSSIGEDDGGQAARDAARTQVKAEQEARRKEREKRDANK